MERNFHRRWGLTSPVHQGDHGGAVKTIAQGMPFVSGGPCECACVFSFIAREAAGASSIRHSLRPRLFGCARNSCKTRARGAARSRNHVRNANRHRAPRSLLIGRQDRLKGELAFDRAQRPRYPRIMRSITSVALAILALAVIGSTASTTHEARKNNAATRLEMTSAFDTLNAKLDRLTTTTVAHEHSDVRLFMIQAHLARATSPIVVLGDSITEAATFPEAICNHPVVNAGIGGAGVDQLLAVAPSLLQGKAPALVVVAIGT